MKLRALPDRVNRKVLFVSVVAAIFVMAFGAALLGSQNQQDNIDSLRRSNTWTATQLEIELLRMMESLDRYTLDHGVVTKPQLMERYDIFWSRIPIALKGSESAALRRLDGVIPLLERLDRELTALEPEISGLDGTDVEAYRRIRHRLEVFEQPLHQMVLAFSHLNGAFPLQPSILLSYGALRTYFIGMLLSALALIWLLVREFRKSARSVEAEHKARVTAEMADRAKTDFLTNVSHELRTPLNAIIGFSELIRDEKLGAHASPRYKEYAESIYGGATHLLEVINDILDMAKIESGRLELDESPFVINRAIQTTVRLISGRATEKALKLTTDLQIGNDRLLGDERIFRQILLNILSNAIKFTPAGGAITVSARVAGDGGLEVTIEDSGIGIPEDEIDQVFEPFYQVDRRLDRSSGGTGLGLPIVRSFMKMHGGTLELISAVGKGTTAIAKFPADRTIRWTPRYDEDLASISRRTQPTIAGAKTESGTA